MERIFIIALKRQKNLYHTASAFWAEKQEGRVFYTIIEPVTIENIEKTPNDYTHEQKKIVRLTEEYNEQNIAKKFSRNKLKSVDFFNQLQIDYFEKNILPFLERKLTNLFIILAQTDIPLFYKDGQFDNIYPNHRIKIYKTPAEAVFNFIREKNGGGSKYFLSIKHDENEMNLTGTHSLIIVNEPCFLLINNNLFQFKNIDGKKLLPFFTKASISIPASVEKKYFATFVKKSIKKYPVKATGFHIIRKKYVPKPVLSLENNFESVPVLILSFTYKDRKFLANDTAQKIVKEDLENPDDYKFFILERDIEREQEIIQQLNKIGLINKQQQSIFEIDANENKKYSIINWLNEHKDELEKINIQLLQNFKNKQYFTERINLDIKCNNSNDWFDIKAVAHFGDYEIPFTELHKYITSGTREFVLPNEEIVILPEEWFARYKDLFLFGKKDDENNQLSINKCHFQLLNQSKIIEGVSNKYINRLQSIISLKNIKHQNPEGINAELRPYQKDGYNWLNLLVMNNLGGCLADDMGLGKTLQTLSIIVKTIGELQVNEKSKKQIEPDNNLQLNIFNKSYTLRQKISSSLIVAPVSLIHNWHQEIKKFTTNIKVLEYIGVNRIKNTNYLNRFDIVLTSYGVVRQDYELLEKYKFLYIVLDESQNIKNPSSKIYHAVKKLQSNYKLVLTGTPIENSLIDLWSQFNFINEGILGNLKFFKRNFVVPIEKDRNKEQQEKLQNLIQPFLLRRTKEEVAKDLPPLTEQTIYCEMSEKQEKYYNIEKSKIRNKLLYFIQNDEINKNAILVLEAITRLRQIANHPKLIEPETMIESGKFNEIIANIENVIAEKHKLLIFSSFTKYLSLFENHFKERKINYSILTGQHSGKQREKNIRQFKTHDNCRVFLISIKAGGTGMNLPEADYVFLLDPWWNPAVENQAIARAHRIGQTQKVFAYRFISKNTIEEKIKKLQQEKNELAELFINNNNPLQKFNINSILELID